MLFLLSMMALADPPTPEPAPTGEPTTETPPPAPVAQEPAPPATGSVAVPITALASRVWVDGQALAYLGAHDAFVAVGLAPGPHVLRVEKDGKLRFEGPLQVSAAVHHRCVPGLGTLECVDSGPALLEAKDPLSPSPTW